MYCSQVLVYEIKGTDCFCEDKYVNLVNNEFTAKLVFFNGSIEQIKQLIVDSITKLEYFVRKLKKI